RIHEEAAHHIDYEDPAPVRRRVEAGAAPRRPGREIDRPQQLRMAIDEADGFPLVPDVVAGADHVDAGGIEVLADLLGDAEAGGGVLAVDDDEVEPQLAAQPRHMLDDHVAARPADDIPTKKYAHSML